MDSSGTVLIVTRAAVDWEPTTGILADDYGYRVLAAGSPSEAAITLDHAHVDLVIADEAGALNACEILAELRVTLPDTIRVLALEADSPLTAPARTAAAVYQLIRRPIDPHLVGLLVKRGLEARELARRHRLLSREFRVAKDSLAGGESQGPGLASGSRRFEKLVYVSEAMAEVCDLARDAARTDMPILILGEAGTGKALLARAIHYHSARRASPLLVQKCAGLSEERLRSDLFGHRKGAFPGADADRLGVIRAADGGTVFLDDVAKLSPALQIDLLRFLEGGALEPPGEERPIVCNVRIIAAADPSLRAQVASGRFRQDLYFALRGFELELPPLRERPDDIAVLAEVFAARFSETEGRKILGISAALLDTLAGYDFPGNVRELENEIHRMVALARDGEYLTTRRLSPALARATPRRATGTGGFEPTGATLKDKVESLEKHLVAEVLARHRWNQSRAASELGLSRVGLANKIRRYELDGGGRPPETTD